MSKSIEPTPQAMPNMVRKARSLCAQMARKTSPKMSAGDCCIAVTHGYGSSGLVVPERALKAAEKSGGVRAESPQRLKPHLVTTTYVRAEARTLQKPEFSAACLFKVQGGHCLVGAG